MDMPPLPAARVLGWPQFRHVNYIALLRSSNVLVGHVEGAPWSPQDGHWTPWTDGCCDLRGQHT